jgi:hypothetical protein
MLSPTAGSGTIDLLHAAILAALNSILSSFAELI